MMSKTQVILVDEHDNPIGSEEKLIAHQQAKLHRAFSVFILRESNGAYELLLQRRHPEKYHTGGLWTNTCCSHPQPGEEIITAATRRLYEEMGINTTLEEIGCFHYTAPVGHGLIENEIDHVLIGMLPLSEKFTVNNEEVASYCWTNLLTLQKDLHHNPKLYTPWFAEALQIVLANCQHTLEKIKVSSVSLMGSQFV